MTISIFSTVAPVVGSVAIIGVLLKAFWPRKRPTTSAANNWRNNGRKNIESPSGSVLNDDGASIGSGTSHDHSGGGH